jgi:predicted DNA binding CopG/RHH family protein
LNLLEKLPDVPKQTEKALILKTQPAHLQRVSICHAKLGGNMKLKIKPKSDAALSVRIPRQLLERIDKEASSMGAKRSQLIVAVLSKAFKI